MDFEMQRDNIYMMALNQSKEELEGLVQRYERIQQ